MCESRCLLPISLWRRLSLETRAAVGVPVWGGRCFRLWDPVGGGVRLINTFERHQSSWRRFSPSILLRRLEADSAKRPRSHMFVTLVLKHLLDAIVARLTQFDGLE